MSGVGDVEIGLLGLDGVIGRLEAGPVVVRDELRCGMGRAVDVVRSAAAAYPAVGTPPGGMGIFARRTENLGRSIVGEVAVTGADVVGTVEARAPYARFVEEGTGLYGPLGRRITARAGGVLAFPVNGNAGGMTAMGRNGIAKGMMFRRSVKGMRGWHFMARAVEQSRDAVVRIFVDAVDVMAARLAGRE